MAPAGLFLSAIRLGATWGPWLLLGPITGPLLAGFIWNWRKGRHVVAGLCALGIVAFWLAAPLLLGWEAKTLLRR